MYSESATLCFAGQQRPTCSVAFIYQLHRTKNEKRYFQAAVRAYALSPLWPLQTDILRACPEPRRGGRSHLFNAGTSTSQLYLLRIKKIYSLSSESSSSPPSAAFLAGFFFLALLFFLPVFLARGCSRIFRSSSSVIFLSDLTFSRSRAGGPPSLVIPFLVIASSVLVYTSSCLDP